jgi:hypothetical protein
VAAKATTSAVADALTRRRSFLPPWYIDGTHLVCFIVPHTIRASVPMTTRGTEISRRSL